ncbi:MAG: hypothetical protein HY746_07975, partial [Elusimicrobia bacterium]|nr:hypothetical protein [Elusimicrobiota bacterium]
LCPEISDELDLTALDAYFSYLYIPYPFTAYKNIKKLEPASCLVFEKGGANITRYWRIEDFSIETQLSGNECIEKIDDLLSKSVTEQMVSDVPLGILFSGGMDSSSVLYYMTKVSNLPVKTFTIGYGSADESFDETVKAQFDEPFADASAIPTYLVTREAHKKVTVALTGIGGDEIFAGYPRYLGARLLPLYIKTPAFFRKIIQAGVRHIPESASAANLPGRIKRFIKADASDFKSAYMSWISCFTKEEKKQLYCSGRLVALENSWHAFSGKLDGYDDIFAFETKRYLASDLLCLSDRTSMANSLELRVPFLDVRLVEFMTQVPLSIKTRGYKLKYLLKKAMSGKLPEQIIKAGKMGFQVPLARWYNEELKDSVREILAPSSLKKSGYLDPAYIENILTEHESGRRNLADQIYAAMMFELWLAAQRRNLAAKKFLALINIKSPPVYRSLGTGGEKILLINMAGLGDIVMMTPILRALKTAYPGSEISLLTIDRSTGLASKLKEISEIFSVPVTYKLPDMLGLWGLFKILFALSKRRFDVALNLRLVSSGSGSWKMRLINAFIKSKFTIGRCLNGLNYESDAIYKEEMVEHKSEVALTARLLEPLGIETADLNIHLDVHESDRAFAESELKRLGISGRKLIGFNPGAFRPSRRWPIENWVKLAEKLLETYPDSVIMVSGSREEAQNYDNLLISDRVKILAGYDMGKLTAFFEKMDLFVTNDTGPMHMAAAVGVKVVGIFGPGDYYRYSPSVNKNKYQIVRKEIPECEMPCYKLKCENPVCLTRITPEDVFTAVKELL